MGRNLRSYYEVFKKIKEGSNGKNDSERPHETEPRLPMGARVH